MTYIRVILVLAVAHVSSMVSGQHRAEMPFTSSSAEAKKLLREAWRAYGDAKFDEADRYARRALERDMEFGMAHAFVHSNNGGGPEQNLKVALGYKLSSDEKLLIGGVLAAQTGESVADYFDPLLKKYPRDYYLNLWIMHNYTDVKKRIEIGQTIISRNPKFAPAYNRLGYVYMEQNNLKNAEKSFSEYLSLRPDLANAYDSKADYLMRVGKIEEAIALYEKAGAMGMAQSKGRADLANAKLRYPAPSADDMHQIKNIISDMSSKFLTGDVDNILVHYSDQAIELFPNQMVNAGIGNIRTRLKEQFRHRTFTGMDRSIQSIEGTGPIALAWGRTKSVFKSGSKRETYEEQSNDIFLFRKQDDGSWKLLVHHWLFDEDESVNRSEDSSSIRQVINKWSFFIKPGEVLNQDHVENYVAVHSPQAVEIFPNQRSNIGIANVRIRTDGFIGIKWAQFIEYNFDINSFVIVGGNGSGRKAVAWGIGDHSNYWKGSDKLSQFLFPWAMILTKENDGQWRILVYHFYIG